MAVRDAGLVRNRWEGSRSWFNCLPGENTRSLTTMVSFFLKPHHTHTLEDEYRGKFLENVRKGFDRPAQQAYQQQWEIGKLQMICSKCGDSFPLAEKPKHSEECSHRETTCSECGMQVNVQHLEKHQDEECEARPVPCEVCGQKIPRSSLAEHMESAWKEHMVALVKEVKMLRTEVKDLRAEVRRQEPS